MAYNVKGDLSVVRDIFSGRRITADLAFNLPQWQTAEDYLAEDLVLVGTKIYICNTAHTASAAFVTDIANWDSLSANVIDDWAATTVYEADDVVVAVSPTTGHTTLYKRIADGTSGATFDDAEEALFTPMASLGADEVFADDTTVAPATAGAPTEAEIAAFAVANDTLDTLVYYTGTDVAGDAASYIYNVDASGNARMIWSAATLPFIHTHDAAGDWGAAAAGIYTMTITAATHGKGTTPDVSLFEGAAAPFTKVEAHCVEIAANGDVSIQVVEAPEGRYAGKVEIR